MQLLSSLLSFLASFSSLFWFEGSHLYYQPLIRPDKASVHCLLSSTLQADKVNDSEVEHVAAEEPDSSFRCCWRPKQAIVELFANKFSTTVQADSMLMLCVQLVLLLLSG